MDAGERGPEEPLELLRAKYLDYCSAQIADLLVYLSADEIYTIAHQAGAEDEVGLSYADMVRVATDWLARRVTLPPFDQWVQDYMAHPGRYEEYLIGVWRSDVEAPSDR